MLGFTQYFKDKEEVLEGKRQYIPIFLDWLYMDNIIREEYQNIHKRLLQVTIRKQTHHINLTVNINTGTVNQKIQAPRKFRILKI